MNAPKNDNEHPTKSQHTQMPGLNSLQEIKIII